MGRRASFIRFISRALIVICLTPLLLVLLFRFVHPPTSAFMIRERMLALTEKPKRPPLHYQWAGWASISPNLPLAVMAAEDQKFPSHNGFDLESIEEAMKRNQKGGRVRGASTISQQVAKNLFLWPGKSYFRKGLEAGFTVLIELLWSKKRILEVYVNMAEFGEGIYGARAASADLFGKPPDRLTTREAALLAAVLPNPKRLKANRPSPYVQGRADWIEEQMAQLGGTAFVKNM